MSLQLSPFNLGNTADESSVLRGSIYPGVLDTINPYGDTTPDKPNNINPHSNPTSIFVYIIAAVAAFYILKKVT